MCVVWGQVWMRVVQIVTNHEDLQVSSAPNIPAAPPSRTSLPHLPGLCLCARDRATESAWHVTRGERGELSKGVTRCLGGAGP